LAIKLIIYGLIALVVWYLLGPMLAPRAMRSRSEPGKQHRPEPGGKIIDGKSRIIDD
jgi:hypothetical protein